MKENAFINEYVLNEKMKTTLVAINTLLFVLLFACFTNINLIIILSFLCFSTFSILKHIDSLNKICKSKHYSTKTLFRFACFPFSLFYIRKYSFGARRVSRTKGVLAGYYELFHLESNSVWIDKMNIINSYVSHDNTAKVSANEYVNYQLNEVLKVFKSTVLFPAIVGAILISVFAALIFVLTHLNHIESFIPFILSLIFLINTLEVLILESILLKKHTQKYREVDFSTYIRLVYFYYLIYAAEIQSFKAELFDDHVIENIIKN